MKHITHRLLLAFGIAFGIAAAPQAQASVVIEGTRIVYQAKDRETTVKLSNNSKTPALTQVWLDRGDAAAAPGSIEVPFTVTPPIARIEGGQAQALRIIHTGEAMPQDKESVYWLNVLEVPPKAAPSDPDSGLLQMAIRTRIKLFYRPGGLKGSAEAAPAQVTWRRTQIDGKPALEGRNPSAFNVSLSEVGLADGDKLLSAGGGMIEPGKTKVFPFEDATTSSAATKVRYQFVNDYGTSIEGEAALGASAAVAAK